MITTPAYLTAAAGILAIEAYHAGSIREQLIQNSSYNVTAYGVDVYQIVGVRKQHFAVLRRGSGLMPCDDCMQSSSYP